MMTTKEINLLIVLGKNSKNELAVNEAIYLEKIMKGEIVPDDTYCPFFEYVKEEYRNLGEELTKDELELFISVTKLYNEKHLTYAAAKRMLSK